MCLCDIHIGETWMHVCTYDMSKQNAICVTIHVCIEAHLFWERLHFCAYRTHVISCVCMPE